MGSAFTRSRFCRSDQALGRAPHHSLPRPSLHSGADSLSLPAAATDGVAEVNHTCAVQTGCFAGDTAGYPVTIDGQAGSSYRLTSNLIVPNENTSGILLSSPDLQIDLNGFAIIRSGCEGATTTCKPVSGSGSGIRRTLVEIPGLSVTNGNITGMGNFGVILGEQAEVTGVRTRWNRVTGIQVGFGSRVSGNTAYGNGQNGIFAENTASTVSGNTVFLNGQDGIFASPGSTVSGNTVFQNGDDGIVTGSGCTVSGNTSYNNSGDGIQTSSGAMVQGNTVYWNSRYGLNLGFQSAYRENAITSNTLGTVSGGVNLFSNSCDGSTICP